MNVPDLMACFSQQHSLSYPCTLFLSTPPVHTPDEFTDKVANTCTAGHGRDRQGNSFIQPLSRLVWIDTACCVQTHQLPTAQSFLLAINREPDPSPFSPSPSRTSSLERRCSILELALLGEGFGRFQDRHLAVFGSLSAAVRSFLS